MARLLVQLKLRLLRNALLASTGARIAFVLSTTLRGAGRGRSLLPAVHSGAAASRRRT